jgi:glucose/arabinose dehydrogenase
MAPSVIPAPRWFLTDWEPVMPRIHRTSLLAFPVGLLMAAGHLTPAYAADVAIPFAVNFQAQSSPTPAGYVADYGQAFDTTRGFGWFNSSHVATSFAGNGRDRNAIGDQRLDTLLHMQLPAGSTGVTGNAIWKAQVPSGTYSLTVAAGDPTTTNSQHVIRAEGQTVLNFTPTAAKRYMARTVRLAVPDGYLTIDTAGGTNTKIQYLELHSGAGPYATGVDPAAGATGVTLDGSVTVQLSTPVDPATMSAGLKVLSPSGAAVAGFYNTDGASSNATFVPSSPLAPNTTYVVATNTNLKTATGATFTPFTSTFTTGTTSTPPTGVAFTTSNFSSLTGVTVLTPGPGNTLYAGTATGSIYKYTLNAAGQPTGTPAQITAFAGTRTITGLHFAPGATPANPTLWVSTGALCGTGCADHTGIISVLTGATTPTSRRDVITGLPRSVKDHMTNGIDFGPDGRLYIAQGSLSGYGAPDAAWGNRAETPLAASVLVADVIGDPRFAGTVNVNTSAGYDPDAPNAPVTIYASGIRNPFSLVWHSGGKLYAPVNESASGNAPAGPGGNPPALNNLPPYNDYFTQVVQGAYYGHPNPSRGTYRLNGGNPTPGADPFQVNEYPVGTAPEANWRKPDLDLGLHRSPNGCVEFTSGVFGPALQGRILVTEYSQGKDVIAIQLDAAGNAVSKTVLASGFYNPIAIATDPVSGRIYVGEYGSDPDGTGGKITLLTPA